MRLWWWAGLILYCVTGFVNIGIIATDDYEFGIARVVPAQNISIAELLASAGIRSPFQNLFLLAFTKTAYAVGIVDPAVQLGVALACIGAINYCLLTTFGYKLGGSLLVFFIGFYFACPLLFTRPLIESLSAPYVLASLYFATRYWESRQSKFLAFSILLLALAAMFRHQAGICAIAIGLLPLLKKDMRSLGVLAAAGAIAFVLSGLLDLAATGELHAWMIGYAKYQMASIGHFGHEPFYVFIGLFLLLSFPPTLFQRYRGFDWRANYRPLVPALLFFAVFVVTHSLIVHKEERFMIPVLPIFFLILLPLVRYTLASKSGRWRIIFFMAINFLLLPFASFNIPQNSLIGTARFLHGHPEITGIREVEGVLFNFPKALIGRSVQTGVLTKEEIARRTHLPCHEVFAIREDIREGIPGLEDVYERVAVSNPGILEMAVIRMNPGKNRRRSPIELYRQKGCRA